MNLLHRGAGPQRETVLGIRVKIVHRAAQAEGLAVVIDVLRAFSTACYLSSAGAGPIWSVSTRAAALRLRQRHPSALLMGERGGCRVPGFDLGNSPAQVVAEGPWPGRSVVMTTSNGTRGLTAVTRAATALTGSFVNAGAIVAYIRRRAPAVVTLVCMGSGGRPAIEDTMCAVYLRSRVMGDDLPFDPIRQLILGRGRLVRFYDPACPDMPLADLDLCLVANRFDFVLQAEEGPEGVVQLVRVDMPRTDLSI